MKIKSLHIRNIASIECADIDFENGLIDLGTGEPAPIFLISGETGAGKSVILDAISMALYKQTPRCAGVNGKQNNKIVVEHGEEINISSIEQYTRIGITVNDDCYSEVVFEGNDQIEYRARLELGLSNKRERDEHGNHRVKYSDVIWTVKVGTNDYEKVDYTSGEPILSAIGLTFEQFGRMAMLAQGQFASFLTGKKDERESILEKLTNTEHFTKYGAAITLLYQKAEGIKKNANTAYETEKVHELGPKDIERYNQQLTELNQEENALSTQITATSNTIKQIEQLEQYIASKVAASEQKKKLEVTIQSDEYKDKELFVRDWDATINERQCLLNMKRAESALLKSQEEKISLQEKYCQLYADLKAREEQLDNLKAQAEEESRWLNERANRDALYTNYEVTNHKIELVMRQQAQLDITQKSLTKEKETSAELRRKVDSAKVESESTKKDANAHQTIIDNVIKEQNELKPEEVNSRLSAIAKEKNALQQLTERIGRLQTALSKIADEKANIEKEKQALAELNETMQKAKKAMEVAQAKSKEANEQLSTMEQSLEETLMTLRKRLVDEKVEHCPLCGQKLNNIYAEEDFRHILTPIEQEQQRLAAECEKCEENYKSIKSQHDKSVGALDNKDKQLRQNINDTEEEKRGIGRELSIWGLMDSDELVPTNVLPKIDAIISNRDAEEEALQEKQKHINKLQETLNTFLQQKKSLDEAYSKAEKQLTTAEITLKNNIEAIERLYGESQKTQDEVEQLTSALANQLDNFYPDWKSDMPGTLNKLTDEAQAYQKRKAASVDTERKIEIANAQITSLHSHLEVIHSEYRECESTVAAKFMECRDIQAAWTMLISQVNTLKSQVKQQHEVIASCKSTLDDYHTATGKDETYLIKLNERASELEAKRQYLDSIRKQLDIQTGALQLSEKQIETTLQTLGVADVDSIPNKAELQETLQERENKKGEIIGEKGAINQKLIANEKHKKECSLLKEKLNEAEKNLNKWGLLNKYFGGTKFRTLVQTHILRPLLSNANIYLEQITDRYRLTCSEENEQLAIFVHDLYYKGCVRSATILSGGERFMISLALSLALSSLNRSDMNVNILFIDEGFGTLDDKSLESVMMTLEKLQEIAGQSNRRVGIISHREELIERIPVQIKVKRKGETRSVIEITNSL